MPTNGHGNGTGGEPAEVRALIGDLHDAINALDAAHQTVAAMRRNVDQLPRGERKLRRDVCDVYLSTIEKCKRELTDLVTE